jgi:endonuclease III
MRSQTEAPVDVVGCEMLGDQAAEPHVFRFQTLVALMLSSQTKDETTAAAMQRLREYGLTVEQVCASSEARIKELIYGVGFHNRKASYIKRTADILVEHHGGDIPRTLKGLLALPGVGPKMGHLCMQCAWKETVGIGVDVHVHRICGLLGWTRKAKHPEDTRRQLEAWLPRERWRPLNKLLVGLGQTVCPSQRPRCGECLAAPYCPTGRRTLRLPRPTTFTTADATDATGTAISQLSPSKKPRV